MILDLECNGKCVITGKPLCFWQELQRENTFLRAQFAQKTEALSKEKMELEKKLSASEVEIQLIRESLKVTLQKHSEEGKKQEERVS